MKGLNHEYMGSTGAPPAAWQGPEDKEELSQQPTQETASHTEILTPPYGTFYGAHPVQVQPPLPNQNPYILQGL